MEIENYESELLTGVVEELVYYNEDNGYAVCYLKTEDDYVGAVGYMPLIGIGESVTLSGKWTYHPEYGKQFKADCYEKNMPKEISEILKYLSSGVIRGVRAATAEKIVKRFGERSLEIISSSPERLAEINGISEKKALEIGNSYRTQLGVRDVVMFLQKFNVSPAYAVKVYKRFGLNSVDVIKKNPYILAEEVSGIGFLTADKIALSMGFERNSGYRLRSAVIYCLWNASSNGHTFLPKTVLQQETAEITGADVSETGTVINKMLLDLKLECENRQAYEAVYLPVMHDAEIYSALKIKTLLNNTEKIETGKLIKKAEKTNNITLTEGQKAAVKGALESGVCVITGGPGTGKTTIINTILTVMSGLKKTVLLAAPTGRAAKRMTEMCNEDASTIHRLLEVDYDEDAENMSFSHNEDNPLSCDALIIDEMSMVDILLMKSVLKALKKGTRIILVGDIDQLPSVGPGYVLRDIISSGIVPVFALNEIFRQASESMIVVNAHKINHGEMPVLNKKDSDFFIVRRENANDIVSSVIDLIKNRLPLAYGYDPITEIQVLSPSRKNVTGVNILNEKLQEALNPKSKSKAERSFRNFVFREGDKVMQIRNNYDMAWECSDGTQGVGIFNGDIGFIKEIDSDGDYMVIDFDDKICFYPFVKLEDLSLSYATTVHKSQGCEFEVIVMPMYPCAPMLMSRNILYTAVTRAKKLVVLVGREEVIGKMVQNASNTLRYSGLLEKLTE